VLAVEYRRLRAGVGHSFACCLPLLGRGDARERGNAEYESEKSANCGKQKNRWKPRMVKARLKPAAQGAARDVNADQMESQLFLPQSDMVQRR
jgi:hypothetical protein